MQEEHERFGLVPSADIVKLDPIGSHVLVTTQRRVLQALRGNWGKKTSESVKP